MYAICSVVKNDVLKAVKAMVKSQYNFPVIQLPKKQYRELEQNQENIPEAARSIVQEGLPHTINKRTMTLHKANCSHQGKSCNLITARIISRPQTTGLKVCRHCFK